LKSVFTHTVLAPAIAAPIVALCVTAAYGISAVVRASGTGHEVPDLSGLILIFPTVLLTSYVFGLIPAALTAIPYNAALLRSPSIRGHRMKRVQLAAALGGLVSGGLVYAVLKSDGSFESPPAPSLVALGIGIVGAIAGACMGWGQPREVVDRVA
jgi:hypothetical protein